MELLQEKNFFDKIKTIIQKTWGGNCIIFFRDSEIGE